MTTALITGIDHVVDNNGDPLVCERAIGEAGASRCGQPARFMVLDRFGVDGAFGPGGRLSVIYYCDQDVNGAVRASNDSPYRRLVGVVRL